MRGLSFQLVFKAYTIVNCINIYIYDYFDILWYIIVYIYIYIHMYSVYICIYTYLPTNKWSLSVQMLWSSNSPRKKKKNTHPASPKQGQPYIWIFIFSFQVWGGLKVDYWLTFGRVFMVGVVLPPWKWMILVFHYKKVIQWCFVIEIYGSLFLY